MCTYYEYGFYSKVELLREEKINGIDYAIIMDSQGNEMKVYLDLFKKYAKEIKQPKKISMMKKVDVLHSHQVLDKQGRRMTITAVVNEGLLHVATSTTTDRDQFCKKIGRDITLGRVASGNFYTVAIVSEDPLKTFYDHCYEIASKSKHNAELIVKWDLREANRISGDNK